MTSLSRTTATSLFPARASAPRRALLISVRPDSMFARASGEISRSPMSSGSSFPNRPVTASILPESSSILTASPSSRIHGMTRRRLISRCSRSAACTSSRASNRDIISSSSSSVSETALRISSGFWGVNPRATCRACAVSTSNLAREPRVQPPLLLRELTYSFSQLRMAVSFFSGSREPYFGFSRSA